jgi:predicted DCC family thiol-disulfide oxidoreductase YuxK
VGSDAGGNPETLSVSESERRTSMPADPLEGLPARLVLFDGVCVVCNRSVDWLLRRDVRGRLCFAPLQGEASARVRAAFPGAIPDGLETIVYLDHSGRVPLLWLRTRALRQILIELGGGPGVTLLRLVPTPIADLCYRLFARLRYALFGRREFCRVPTPAERLRFLD